jgi:hypothetical protein
VNTLNLVLTILCGLSTLAVVLRFIGKWTSRVISELIEQTEVFKGMSKQLTGIAAASVRIEARQKQIIYTLNSPNRK